MTAFLIFFVHHVESLADLFPEKLSFGIYTTLLVRVEDRDKLNDKFLHLAPLEGSFIELKFGSLWWKKFVVEFLKVNPVTLAFSFIELSKLVLQCLKILLCLFVEGPLFLLEKCVSYLLKVETRFFVPGFFGDYLWLECLDIVHAGSKMLLGFLKVLKGLVEEIPSVVLGDRSYLGINFRCVLSRSVEAV